MVLDMCLKQILLIYSTVTKDPKAYLSVIKDGFTKQILAYVLSPSLEVDFVLETINQLYSKHKHNIHTDALIHSDRGVHYTSVKFIDLLKSLEIRQSMSRRGNCWDNAPQESFFGHMKNEIGRYTENACSYEELKGNNRFLYGLLQQ